MSAIKIAGYDMDELDDLCENWHDPEISRVDEIISQIATAASWPALRLYHSPLGWFDEYEEELKHNPNYIASNLSIAITNILWSRMNDKGMTQKDLAKKMGKSQPYVSKVLIKGTNMTLHTLAMFATALDLEIEAPRFIPKETTRLAQKILDFVSVPPRKDVIRNILKLLHIWYISMLHHVVRVESGKESNTNSPHPPI